jgi:hypothetical protein
MNNRIQLKKAFVGTKALLVLCIAFFALSCNQVLGQVKFSINAQPDPVPVNQQFQLDIAIENGEPTQLTPGAMGDFQVLQGPFSSSFSQNINGQRSKTVTYTYVLKPKQEGTFKIGKAKATINGVTMESNELTVTVTKAVAQQPQAQRQQDPFDPFGMFGRPQQRQQEPEVSQADLAKKVKDDVFLKLELSRSSVYEGEMLSASYRLYFKQNIEPPKIDKAPAFDGFLSQEVELDPKRRPKVETYNGKQYYVVDLFKYNLYPQHSGSLKLPVAEIQVVAVIQRQPMSAFDAFFNDAGAVQVPLNLKTEAAAVNVKPLPEKDKPADFTGAVGKFNFETSVSSKEGKTDDPITYTVKISGTGNLKLIEQPKLNLPPAFEVYDPKTKENISNGAAGLTGSKQYDFLIIPRQPGDYKIDGRSFSYFDPSAAKYVTVNSPEYALKITGAPSKNMNTGASASVSKQDISLLGQDIRYIKTSAPEFKKEDTPFFGSLGFIGLYSTPAILFLGLIAFRRRNETMAADIVGTKRRRALKLAKKRLSVADKHLKTDDKKAFYDEVSRATWGYLGDKLNIDMAELSKDNVEDKLQARSVKPETIVKLKSLINTCEMALYAPVSDEQTEMKKNYDTAMNLIADLEDEIKA